MFSVNSMETNPYQKKILTIPNIMSFFRLVLIPIIVYFYVVKENYLWTLILLVVSGLTDIVDGFIARKFKMISDFGKAIDPIADKLTQLALLCCLLFRFNYMIIPIVLMVIKEVASGITCLVSIKKTKEVNSSVWHGKLTTVSLYSMIAIHLIWFNIPTYYSLVFVGFCVGIMLMSFIMYINRNLKQIKNAKK